MPDVTRRTKIVATLGPSTEDPSSLRGVLEAGADVVRLNGAHGTPASHARAADRARRTAARLDRNLGVLVDLPGPKLRVGAVPGDEIRLEEGATFALTAAGEPLPAQGVTTNVPGFEGLVEVGDAVWLADGEILLDVRTAENDRVVTEVVRGGVLRSRKGLALPDSERILEPFTPADREILALALHIGAELVGVSFVATGDDVQRVRHALGDPVVPPLLVAKVETRQALDHIEEIIAAADAVMVARGDLGVQIGVARTPLAQKEIIELCNRAGRPAITATQMLESMTRSPLPTRAEASDVANAVLDGTDALMLSEETGVGSHPTEAVATMARLAVAAESWRHAPSSTAPSGQPAEGLVAAAVARAAVHAAREAGAAAIVCHTATGATPRRVASLRPNMPIVAVSEAPAVTAGLALVWGVTAMTASAPVHDPRATVATARAAGTVLAGALVTVVTSPRPGSSEVDGSVHVLSA